jgi:Ca2+-binding RTX toxin-like protein
MLTGDSASDKLALRVRPGVPDILETDIGADGTPDLLFDRSTFTSGATRRRTSCGPTLLGDEDTITSGVTTAGTARVVADGGDGFDHAIYKGTAAGDTIQAALVSATEFAAFAPGAAPFGAAAATEDVDLQGLDGPDTIALSNGIRGLTVDGGAGDDDLRGGSGPDVLLGGSGNDHVDGNIGADVASWAPAPTSSSGIRATPATRSTARAARIAWTSTRRTPARSSASP